MLVLLNVSRRCAWRMSLESSQWGIGCTVLMLVSVLMETLTLAWAGVTLFGVTGGRGPVAPVKWIAVCWGVYTLLPQHSHALQVECSQLQSLVCILHWLWIIGHEFTSELIMLYFNVGIGYIELRETNSYWRWRSPMNYTALASSPLAPLYYSLLESF